MSEFPELDQDDNDNDDARSEDSTDTNRPVEMTNFIPPTVKVLENGSIDCYPEDPNKILKKIVKNGEGSSCSGFNNVLVHYVGSLEDGTVFDSTRERKEPVAFKIGSGQVVKGLDYAVVSMKVGEIADFSIAPEYCKDEHQLSESRIPEDKTVHFNIELLSVEKFPETAEERINYGLKVKEEGNEFVKKGNWEDALESYEKGLAYVKFLYMFENVNEKNQAKEVCGALQLNKALCLLKLGKAKDAVKTCNEIIEIDKKNVSPKVYFRRGIAQRSLLNLEDSRRDLLTALQLAPNDAGIKKEYEITMQQIRHADEKQKKAFKSLFN